MPRAQTTIDYAIGVSIFLIVVAFVFTMVPNLFAPYQSGIQSGQPVQTERFTERTYTQVTYANGTLYANATDPGGFFAQDESALRGVVGADGTTDVNVTLSDGSSIIGHVGPTPTGSFTAATRVVVGKPGNTCGDGCEVVVRVW